MSATLELFVFVRELAEVAEGTVVARCCADDGSLVLDEGHLRLRTTEFCNGQLYFRPGRLFQSNPIVTMVAIIGRLIVSPSVAYPRCALIACHPAA